LKCPDDSNKCELEVPVFWINFDFLEKIKIPNTHRKNQNIQQSELYDANYT
jgi:hypothetical protein